MPQPEKSTRKKRNTGSPFFSGIAPFFRDYWGVALTLSFGALLFALWRYWPSILRANPVVSSAKDHLEAAGQFGDQFGALSCLLSGLTLAGIVFGIMLQAKQLRHAEKEAADERGLRNALQFERQLFDLLPLMEREVQHLREDSNTGVAAYRSFARRILTQAALPLADPYKDDEFPQVAKTVTGEVGVFWKIEQVRLFQYIDHLVRMSVATKDPATAKLVTLCLGEEIIGLATVWRLAELKRYDETWHQFWREACGGAWRDNLNIAVEQEFLRLQRAGAAN